MLSLILTLLLGALPYKHSLNDIERLCMRDGYFLINWKTSPLTVCEDPLGTNYCYIMNPYDTALRFNNHYLRIVENGVWAYDLGHCYENIPLQR